MENGKTQNAVAMFSIAVLENGQLAFNMQGKVNRDLIIKALSNALVEFVKKYEADRPLVAIPDPIIRNILKN